MSFKTKRIILSAMLVVALLSVLLVGACKAEPPAPTTPTTPTDAPAAPEVIEWKLHYFAPAGDFYDLMVVDFADRVRAMSGGRLDITPYPEGALVPPTELVDAVKNGTIEMAAVLGSYHSGVIPVTNLVYGFPATYRSYADKVIHHKYFGFDDIEAEAFMEQGGVIHVGTDSVDGGYTLISKKKITKASDIAGMKIRATGAVGLVFEELGASVVFMPGSELYTALATGVIDGLVYGGPQTELEVMKFGEVAQYLTMPELLTAHGHNSYIANVEAWNALPADLQAIVKNANDVKTGDYYPYAKFTNQNSINKYAAEGQIEVINLPIEEFNKIAAAGEAALAKLVADKNDPYLTRGAESLTEFMKWRGYWK